MASVLNTLPVQESPRVRVRLLPRVQDVDSSSFYLELARLTGCTWPPRGEEDSAELDSVDPSQLVRLSAPLNASWSTIMPLCLFTYQSEYFFRCISEEQWLRTVVKYSGFSVYYIHSNVMPKQAYLTWLEGMKVTCSKGGCRLGFVPATLPDTVLTGRCCSDCALGNELKCQTMCAAKFVKFWYLEETDVEVVDHKEAMAGSDGEVCKILWRHGTFARKRFSGMNPDENPIFKHEVEVALTVSHPNIVHFFGWSDGPSDGCLFMEWLEVDLERFLHERGRDEMSEPFPFQDTLVVLLQIAEAMKHLHEKRFVHGDLKPGNLLMSKVAMPGSDGHFYLVKVTDFGRTQSVDQFGATVKPFYWKIGSPFYTAPEVLMYRKNRSEPPKCLYKIDVYSFGVVAYQVVTGVESQDFGTHGLSGSSDNVMKPDGDGDQWRPSRDFDSATLDQDRLSLLPLIESCWASSPDARPDFERICRDLRELYDQYFPVHV